MLPVGTRPQPGLPLGPAVLAQQPGGLVVQEDSARACLGLGLAFHQVPVQLHQVPGDHQHPAIEVGIGPPQRYGQAAAVAAEDDEDGQFFARRPSGEAKAAHALDRIGRGTYTEPAWFRPARDTEGMFAVSCGEAVDEFGRCASRYHQAGCHTLAESAAARGSAGEAAAWVDVLTGRANPPGTSASELGLANEPGPWDGTDLWSDLLQSGEPHPGLHDQMMHQLGEAAQPEPEPRPDLPPVDAIRAALGI